MPFFVRSRSSRRQIRLLLELLEDRTVPTLLGNTLFPTDNPWNQPIANAPVAANSAAIMNNILSTYGDGRFHPDFGQDAHTADPLYGIPYNVAHASTPKVLVVIDAYPTESDLQDVPIPTGAVLENDLQNGPLAGVDNRFDSHLIVYDVDNNIGYELYRASRPSENADNQWHADGEAVWDFKTNEFRTLGWTSADAAGLAILPGLARPDEGLPVNQGGQGVINHALRITLKNAIVLDQFLYPASHVANPGNTNAAVQPPMGARFRLKASIDISQLGPQSKIIAQAMKDYGLIVADNGSNFFVSGASDAVDTSNGLTLTWDDNDIQDNVHGLKSLNFSDFEVVDLTPVVTGLSVSEGNVGTSITITGQNFSGAAGRLQVLFGSAPANNVTVLDDSHVTATAPAGAGTVDVRVQSGVNDPGDTQNIKAPVFGYGTSAVTPADQFSYPSPPTITSSNHVAFLSGLASTFNVTTTGGHPAPAHLSESGALPSGVTFVDQGNGVASLSGAPDPGTGGTYSITITAANGDNSATTTQTFTLSVDPAGFAYDANTKALSLTGTNFMFTQATADNGSGPHTAYTCTLDGTTFTLQDSEVAQVFATGQGAAVAVLVTNDTYVGPDGKTHETVESLPFGPGGGTVYKYDAAGNPSAFLFLQGFHTSYAYVGRADFAQLDGVVGNNIENVFVTAGSYGYIFGQGEFHLISGAPHLYGYARNRTDQVWHYDAPGSLDSFVASGNAFSYLSGADTNGHSFFNVGVGFTVSYGIATHGNAIAYLIDSPGNDVFFSTSGYSYLSGADVFNVAVGFNLIYGESFVGGVDYAYNHDPAHNIITGFRRLA